MAPDWFHLLGHSRSQLRVDTAKLLQRELQARDDVRGDLDRWRKAVGVGRARVLQPEDVEVQLVALGELLVAEAAEAFAGLPLVPAILLPVGADEIVEVGALERALAQGEPLVGAEVVDPQGFGVDAIAGNRREAMSRRR